MTINYNKIERVMEMMLEGYNNLPEDTEGMKERKESLISLVDTVQDEMISNGINNVTMETIYALSKKAREEAKEVCDNKCHVYGWLTSELYERYGL